MKTELTGKRGKGKELLYDYQDTWLVDKYSWNLSSHGYVICCEGYFHRMVLGLEKGDRRVVDHINGNKLDNTRYNLRVTEYSNNAQNQRHKKAIGVHKVNNMWRAQIKCKDKRIHIGYFTSKKEAMTTYNEYAIALFGSDAKLNKDHTHG